MSNLLMLCPECNRQKADKVYYPGDYYTFYAEECGGLIAMTNIVVQWFKKYKSEFWFDRFPLISPSITSELMREVKGKQFKTGKYLDILLANRKLKDKYRDLFDSYLPDTPHYMVISRDTEKLCAVLSVKYNYNEVNNRGVITVRVLYEDVDTRGLYAILNCIVSTVVSRYKMLNAPIDYFTISMANRDTAILLHRNGISTSKVRLGALVYDLGDETMLWLSCNKEAHESVVKQNFRNNTDMVKYLIKYLVGSCKLTKEQKNFLGI